MNELTPEAKVLEQNMNTADQIIQAAYDCFIKSKEIQQKALNESEDNQKQAKWVILAPIILYFFRGLYSKIFAVIMAACIVAYFFVFKPKMKEEQKGLYALAQKEEEKGKSIIMKNYEYLTFLPQRYWIPMATSYMLEMIRTCRAKTLTEALDRFDEQIYRWTVVENQEKQIILQKSQLDMMEEQLKELKKKI